MAESLPRWFSDQDRKTEALYQYALSEEDGVPVIRFANGNHVKWRGDCSRCVSPEAMGDSDFWPEHEARCGHNTHCSCFL